jgi:hypothetical protein
MQRIASALFVVLLLGPSSSGSDATIILVLELIGLLLFIPFLGYLYSLVREAQGPRGWLATTALGAGLVDITIKLGSIAPAKAEDGVGETTALQQALHDMNNVAFIATIGHTSPALLVDTRKAPASALSGRLSRVNVAL